MTEDLTLDEIRVRLARGIAANAAFDGWTDAARDFAAEGAGIDRDVAALAFEHGAIDMIDAWFATIDTAMLAAVPPERLATMKIRARITALIEARARHPSPAAASGEGHTAGLADGRHHLARGGRRRDRL